MKYLNARVAYACAVLAFLIVPAFALAATFNDDPQDFGTLRVSNYTDNPGCGNCWGSSVSADPGDTVSFAIYYHNTSSEAAEDVRVKLTPETTSDGTSHTFTASVWADNASTVSGSATVTLLSSESVSYNGKTFWYPNQSQSSSSLPSGQDGSEVFDSNGLLLGDIGPGWGTQGSVVVRFDVSEAPAPTVSLSASPSSVDDGDKTTLSWSSSNADSCTATGGDGFSTSGATSGSDVSNSLFSDETFSISCSSTGGTDTDSVFVPVDENDELPDVITLSAGGVGERFATIRGHADPNGSSGTRVWFEWDDDTNLSNETPHEIHGSQADTFSRVLNNIQPNTTYYYRAFAENDAGGVQGTLKSFTTDDNGGSNGGDPIVVTKQATSITKSAATFACHVDPNDGDNTERWFEWGETTSVSNQTTKINHGSSASDFSWRVSGLEDGEEHYFRCVAENDEGTTHGSIRSFTTDTDEQDVPPRAITNLATNVGRTSARFNGLALIDGGVNTQGWFEWGLTTSLGNSTSVQNIGSNPSSAFIHSAFGLSPNTTYYYRAVVQNEHGIDRGQIRSFRTEQTVIVDPNPNPNPQPVRDIEIMKEVENLVRPNGDAEEIEALIGDLARFKITVENTGNLIVEDLRIIDRVPDFLEFANAEEENENDPQREVVWFVGDLEEGEKREVILDVIITEDAELGEDIENVARIESVRLDEGSNVVIITPVDEINGEEGEDENGSEGAGLVLFGGGFFPDSFIGWLLLVILIIILVIASRRLYGYRQSRLKQEKEAAAAADASSNGGISPTPNNPHAFSRSENGPPGNLPR